MFWWKRHPKTHLPSLSKPCCFSESPPNDDSPPPEMLKTTLTGYLNCPQRTDMWVFSISFPSPLWGLEKSTRKFYPLNLGFFVIWFDLV